MGTNLVLKYMKELDYQDIAEFTEASMMASWPAGYNKWRILKSALREAGIDLSKDEGYMKYFKSRRLSLVPVFDQAMREMGLMEIKDIKTIGRLFSYAWNNFLCPTEIIEETADRCVYRTTWCANPFYGPMPYGPMDCMRHYQEYYRVYEAGFMTRDVALLGLAIYAKNKGFKEEIEIELPWAMCRDGEAPYCLYIIKKKDSPEYEMPTLDRAQRTWFLEDEIELSGEKPVAYVAKKLGMTMEELASKAFYLMIRLNIGSYNGWEQDLGKKKAMDMYQEYWLSLLSRWFRDAKVDLEIGKVGNLIDLAKIFIYCQKKKFTPYVMSNENRRVTLTTENDPHVEIPKDVFSMELNASYFDAVTSADNAFVERIIVNSGMEGEVTMITNKRIAKGDKCNEIVISYK